MCEVRVPERNVHDPLREMTIIIMYIVYSDDSVPIISFIVTGSWADGGS